MKIFPLSIIFFSISLDQISKRFAQYVGQMKLSNNLYMSPAWNKGVSFSMLSSLNGTLITVVLCLVCLYVVQLLYKTNKSLEKIGLSMLLGGGLSNLVDRMIFGKVFDFILVRYESWQFAVFNVADVFITIGAALILFDMLKKPSKRSSKMPDKAH